MHNQPEITHNSYSYDHWHTTVAEPFSMRPTRKGCSRKFLLRLKYIAEAVLAALAVGTLLMGGIYFFLVQLANHGW